MITGLLWIAFAFLCGALPFSVWVGQIGLRKNIREFGDSNPGATNVLRAGNFYWFALALALDISKAVLPVGLAYQVFELRGWVMVGVALAPPLGHAFSPLLNFQGGKAIAAAFGVWVGLGFLAYAVPALAFVIVWSLLITPSGWAVMLTMASLGALFFVRSDLPVAFLTLIGQSLLFAFRHVDDLARAPRLYFVERRKRRNA